MPFKYVETLTFSDIRLIDAAVILTSKVFFQSKRPCAKVVPSVGVNFPENFHFANSLFFSDLYIILDKRQCSIQYLRMDELRFFS